MFPTTFVIGRSRITEQKRTLKISTILTSILFLLAVSSAVVAGIRPSFSPEGCSWRASDIVVVTEGSQIDGKFQVLETWKGDLKPGETISVPELAQFKEKDARLIFPKSQTDKPQYVSGEFGLDRKAQDYRCKTPYVRPHPVAVETSRGRDRRRRSAAQMVG